MKCNCARKIISNGLIWVIVTIAVVAFDRYSKGWMLANLSLGEPLQLLPFFNFTLAYNTGAAFSFLHSASGWQNIFFTSLAFIMSVVILVWLARTPANERWSCLSLSLILGGAIGNAWDRLQFGYVIDFLHFHIGDWNFAIFNFADCAISVGAIMLIVQWVFFKKE